MMQQDDNQKNLLLAIVLSVGVLLGWQLLYAGPKMKEEQERRARQQQTELKGQPTTSGQPGAVAPSGTPALPGSAPAASVTVSRADALKQAPRVAIDTPSLKGSISLKGARIDDLGLVKYHETVDRSSPSVVLLSPENAPEPYYAEHQWVAAPGASVRLPDKDTVWTQRGDGTLTPDRPLQLTWNNGQGVVFNRTIKVDKDYLFTIVDEVENTTANPLVLYPYARIHRVGTPKIEGFYILHEGLIGVLGDKGLQEITYANVLKDDGSKTVDKLKGGWLGITDKYWATALIPPQTAEYRASLRATKKQGNTKEAYVSEYLQDAVNVPAGGKASTTGLMFAGAKQVHVVEGYEKTHAIQRFDLMIDWGLFHFITKPLFVVLSWLNGLLGNFGLAILATTVIVKLLFFPLANKSYESMAKMKKLQPEMEAIRERFKDDRARQQQELMALYSKQKINPMSGCLPILLQIPVFFALYKVLFVSIDMRHAPFYGWIKDLSAQDPTSIFNLFGLLPFSVPHFLVVGAWPIIMGITMWVQMQLNPQQPDPMQQRIFNWMPVMFTFLLASFPAGLVIYWAWNNVLSLIQQYAIMRKNGTEIHLWKNLGIDKLLNGRGAIRK